MVLCFEATTKWPENSLASLNRSLTILTGLTLQPPVCMRERERERGHGLQAYS